MTSKIEYPKALYLGDTVNYKMATAQDAEEEKILREANWTDFADLPEGKEQLPQADGQSEALANAMERIAELEAEVRSYQLKDMPADELKAILTGRKIAFSNRDSKETLLKLVIESE